MAQTPISPKQSNPSAATLTEIHDCPDGESFIGWIYATNRSNVQTSIRISVEIDNAGTSVEQFIAYDLPIGSFEVLGPWKITLTADDRVNVYATLATVSFGLFGVAIS